MSIELCTSLSSSEQLISLSTNDLYLVTEQFSSKQARGIWVEPTYEIAPQTDSIRQAYLNLVSTRQFEKAIDFMLNEIYGHSQILAEKFGFQFEDKTEIASLLEKLSNAEVISSEELNRLTILQMAIDGLDIEVYEYGATMNLTELVYLNEFLSIIKTVLARNDTYVGTFQNIATGFGSCTFQSTNNIIFVIGTIHSTVVNPSTTCVFSSTFTNLIDTKNNYVSQLLQ